MSRNPMAGSLRNFRQRIVPDKRVVLTDLTDQEIQDWLDAAANDGSEG